jgi:hypothetical protein
MLTIWNMQRLSVLDRAQARRMTAGAILICAVGLGVMFGVAPKGSEGVPEVDSNARSILAVATAALCYFAQRQSFRMWRLQNERLRTGSWLNALGMAVLYTIVAATLAAPFWLISQSLVHTSAGPVFH